MKTKAKPLTNKEGEVRELTRADFRRMRPAREVVPEIVALYAKSRGRPRGQNKQLVTLRLDKPLVKKLREGGAGWQTRVNDLLSAALDLRDRH